MRNSNAIAALLIAALCAFKGAAAQQEATAPEIPKTAKGQAEPAQDAPCPLVGAWLADSISLAPPGGTRKTLSGQGALCRVIVDGKTLKIHVGTQLLTAMSYVVDRKQDPWTIDLKSPDGAMIGICQCKHDKLQISVNDPSQGRPKDFEPEHGGMVLDLRRVRGLSLFVIEADGGDARPLAIDPELTFVGSPDWSPDGSKIAFDGWRSAFGEGMDQAHILVVNADGSGMKDLGLGAVPGWSPDGKRFTYTRYAPHRGVWMMDADGSNPKLIDTDAWGSQWARKHNKIAYAASGENGGNICIYDVDTGKRRMLLDRAYTRVYWGIAWSSDDQWVAFKGDLPDGGAEVAAVNVEGEDKGFKVLLPSSAPESGEIHYTLSWDVTKGVVISTRGKGDRLNQLYLLDFAGKNPPRRYSAQLPERSKQDMAVSPDGKKLVVATASPTDDEPRE